MKFGHLKASFGKKRVNLMMPIGVLLSQSVIQKMAFRGGIYGIYGLYTKIANTPPLPMLVTSRINA